MNKEKFIEELESKISEVIEMALEYAKKRIEEIDVYIRNDGEHYVTSADHGMELYKGKELEDRKRLHQEIIDTFHKLY